ncbi:hydrogen peroxide-inducible genes activator [Kordiimonas sp. SCSIO 12610]|uniref:hydrogen peroxide-inducible genes activator n=1 Tax=Kordiimonas sp. SCSIO 12610 TaxID=2829597 RepID=UPI00210EE4BC|nr:hydrogen peroxide-inducible genes activator [Kordiimonas sp. SCSIO 12610]UTW55702.1 hydrogen peroxide-inducible genes activator [Kordiimonas sp. SCSIO 12610]
MNYQKITLKQLRYLVALDEEHNYRKAAQLCGISQPSLSIQLQNLETTLEVQLIERSRSGVFFTPTGREVLAKAREVLATVQGIHDIAESGRHSLAGTIRLGTKSTLGPYLLPKVVQSLHKHYPDLKLYIRECDPREMEAELLRGDHDVILAQLPINNEQLNTVELFREPLLLALANDHRLATLEKITAADLKGEQVLTLNPRYHLHDQIGYLCEDFGATILKDYEGTSLDALRQMVGMGMGITFLPELYAKSEIRGNSDVIVRPLFNKNIYRSIGLVWRKGAAKSNSYERIVEVIKQVIKTRF